MDALASEAEDYAALAEEHRKSLDGLGDFDVALIDEAKVLAVELRRRPTAGVEPSPAQREALELRNRIGTLPWRNISLVRSAARFVFRHHPAILREAMSTYERKARAERRRAAKKKAGEGGGA